LIRAILALFGLLAAAAAGAESLTFKGLGLGAAISAVAGDPRYNCQAAKAPGADRICSLRPQEQETVAGAPVNAIFWFFYRGHLTSLTVHFDAQHFNQVTQALASKYGAAEISRETVRNLKGASFDNQVHTWRQGSASLVARRFTSRVDKSSLRLADADRIREIDLRREQSRAAPETDL
jgi:hypothetical protein